MGVNRMAVVPVVQPVAFPHRVHVDSETVGLSCDICHAGALTQTGAGIPPLWLCASCHAAMPTESDAARDLKAFIDTDRPIPWQRVWRLPAHTFFSHRTHTAVAGIDCAACHGDMASLDAPPIVPLKTLTMADCIACHTREQGGERQVDQRRGGQGPVRPVSASSSPGGDADCTACHR